MTARINLTRSLFIAGALVLAPALGGCGSMIADLPVVGLPTGAPARPADSGAFLPVHDVPDSKPNQTLSNDELARVQAELVAARDRQAVPVAPAPASPTTAEKITRKHLASVGLRARTDMIQPHVWTILIGRVGLPLVGALFTVFGVH